MRGQQVEEDALVTFLQLNHVKLLLICLVIPEKVQSGGPLHLTTVKENGKGKVENDQRADDCQGNVVSKGKKNNIDIKNF